MAILSDILWTSSLYTILRCVQEKEGITICATIHCPSIETFRLFDRVLLLQHGRAVYHGDNGAPVIDYFQTSFPDVRQHCCAFI